MANNRERSERGGASDKWMKPMSEDSLRHEKFRKPSLDTRYTPNEPVEPSAGSAVGSVIKQRELDAVRERGAAPRSDGETRKRRSRMASRDADEAAPPQSAPPQAPVQQPPKQFTAPAMRPQPSAQQPPAQPQFRAPLIKQPPMQQPVKPQFGRPAAPQEQPPFQPQPPMPQQPMQPLPAMPSMPPPVLPPVQYPSPQVAYGQFSEETPTARRRRMRADAPRPDEQIAEAAQPAQAPAQVVIDAAQAMPSAPVQPVASFPTPQAAADEAPHLRAAYATPAAQGLQSTEPAPETDEDDAIPTSRMAQPAPVPLDVQEKPRKGSRALIASLIAITLIAAAALALWRTGVLSKLFANEAPPPISVTSVVSLPETMAPAGEGISPALAQDAPRVDSFTASAASATAPATIGFEVHSNANASDIRLLSDHGSSLFVEEVKSTGDDTGILWEFTVRFESAFDGDIRPYMRNRDGVWESAGTSLHITVK